MTDHEEQPSAKRRRQRPSAKRKRIDTTLSPSNCSFENEKHQQRASWSDLPKELLRPIFHRLQESDIIRCAEVCVSWESEVKTILPQYLLLTNLAWKSSKQHSSILLFNTQTHKIREIYVPKFLEGRWFSSSSFGWILTVATNQNPPNQVHLLNPISRERIELPPTKVTKHVGLENLRVITSTNPSDANCLFLAIQSRCSLAFCRQGHKSWTCLNFGLCFCDAIFYKGEFYAIDISNCLFHLNCNLHHEAKRLNLRNLTIGMSNSKYLVELNGDLLLVVRLMNERFAKEDSLYRSNYVDHFKVYKFDWVKKKWILVTRIGNYAILLGKYSSISIPDKLSRHFKANCIYFIDDSSSNFPYECESSNRETGLYDMSTDQIKPLYQSSPIWTNQLQWFRPRE